MTLEPYSDDMTARQNVTAVQQSTSEAQRAARKLFIVAVYTDSIFMRNCMVVLDPL